MSQRRKKREFINDIVLQRIDRLLDAAAAEFPTSSATQKKEDAFLQKLRNVFRLRNERTRAHKRQTYRYHVLKMRRPKALLNRNPHR